MTCCCFTSFPLSFLDVSGVPGTGKTMTVREALRLVSSDTNVKIGVDDVCMSESLSCRKRSKRSVSLKSMD